MTPCDKIQAQLSAYLDAEMNETQTRVIAAHLEKCPPCSEAASTEKAIKALVHERAPARCAPPELHARIRHELRSADQRFEFWALLRRVFEFHPRPAFAALALMLVGTSVLTYLGSNALASLVNPVSYETNVRLEGNIVCADCQLMLITHTPCTHDAQVHRLALKCKDGKIWNIVQSPQGRELLQALGGSSRLVQTEGYLFPRVGYMQVTNFKVMQN